MNKILKIVLPIPIILILSLLMVYFFQKHTFTAKKTAQFDALTSLLVVSKAFDEHGQITLSRLGKDHDGGYMVPDKALEHSDVLLGYGVANDISFEEQFSQRYDKPSYGFDCGVQKITHHDPHFTFVRECISSDKFLYRNQQSSDNIRTFTQQLDQLKLRNKNIFVKMDIEGAEYAAFNDIFQYTPYITGILIEIHFTQSEQTEQAIQLISKLNESFALLHIHGNNCTNQYFSSQHMKGPAPRVLELTYINKALVHRIIQATKQDHPDTTDQTNCPNQPEHTFEITPRVVPSTQKRPENTQVSRVLRDGTINTLTE